MNVNRTPHLLTLALAALLTTACGSLDLPDILGGGGDTGTSRDDVVEVRGTVEDVDTRDRVIVVDGDARYDLRNGGGDTLAIYYDSDTVVEFEGRTYSPADLERGDRIVADVDDSGSRLLADRIEVVYDVTGGVGSIDDDDRVAADLRGTVRSVDTYDRTIELERIRYGLGFDIDADDGSDLVTLHYDAETVVEVDGRFYSPENLERGDVIEVEVVDTGDRLIAEEIELVSDVRAGLGVR